MDIFSLFSIIGGLALFLYGMNVMSNGLEKMAGSRLEKTLAQMTSNQYKAFAFGTGLTAAVQSSTAITVMAIGLVNSGIMQFEQTIGIIMGSNVGTTITAWILSLINIDSKNSLIKLLNPEYFSPLIAFAGILLMMTNKRGKKRDIGTILIGFAVLMYGITIMKDSVEPLSKMQGFMDFLVAMENPLLGVALGAVLTALIQSSSASIGILTALSVTGTLSFAVSIPIILGANIGSCITALISSIGTNKNAKRVAIVHLYFNLIGTSVFMILFFIVRPMIGDFLTKSVTPVSIAIFHTAFNVITTLILLPFAKMLEKLARLTVRKKGEIVSYELLDERLLSTPAIALAESRNVANKMAELTKDTFIKAVGLMDNYDPKVAQEVVENEEQIDMYEDKLGLFLVQLSNRSLTNADNKEVSKLLHSIGDFERIGDHAYNIMKLATEMAEKNIVFSPDAVVEKNILADALKEILEKTVETFRQNNEQLAYEIEPLEQVVDGLRSEMKRRHVSRLQSTSCTIELGFIYTDFISNCERVSDHCSNIAIYVLQTKILDFEPHTYITRLKNNEFGYFEKYEAYKEKYLLPVTDL